MKKIRREAGITVREMAKYLNITPALLCRIETRCVEPSHDILTKIAERLNISEHNLMETWEKHQSEEDRDLAMIAKGMSNCCNAPLDCSHVIRSGSYEGHGPRFCSKCKRVVFWV